ncbi:MAG: DUF2628 domain-containing protein [Oscillospiraceae bacterium]|nr:DUF2628 domain-containing protein [Oscillospiraceae bacterium]
MQNFLGNPCPYCGKIFNENDDIVVCPECGTPHHRDCYKEHSACANEEKHSEKFEWKSSVFTHSLKPEPIPEEKPETVLCAHCGKENPGSAHYCLGCGAPLISKPVRDKYEVSYEEFQRERERIFTESFGSDFEGVSAKEAAIYVRSNIGYFLPRFAAFSKGAKFDTNFSAFIFSYFYLFYRKMYGLGIGVFLATLILSIPTSLLDFQLLQEQYVEMGLLSQVIWNVPHQETLAIYSIIANLLIWVIRIALMMFFNKLYYSKMIQNIKQNRPRLANKSENEISAFFKKKGGTSFVVPIIILVLSFAASFVLAGFIVSSEFFIMPDVSKFL